jgi:tRNA modification GTPase
MSDEQPLAIAARITAPGRSAIATISVDGPAALQHVTTLFHPSAKVNLDRVDAGRIVFGRWGIEGPEAGEEVVVCVHRPQKVEIHCHGGAAAAKRILQSLYGSGCQLASTEQWLAANTPELLRQETTLALTHAATTRVAGILLDQWRGALQREVERSYRRLAEGALESVAADLRTLLSRAQLGCHLVGGWHIVLAGRPNVGKSSLINALLGYQRAIVFDQAGTTRDVVTAGSAIDGWPVQFSDTAGIAQDAKSTEAAGVALAWQHVADADLVIFVSDLTHPWTDEDERILRHAGDRALIVHNKSDLVKQEPPDRPPGIRTSARQNHGVEELVASISTRLVPTPPQPDEAVPFNQRQTQCLRDALDALGRGLVRQAQEALRTLTTQESHDAGTPL